MLVPLNKGTLTPQDATVAQMTEIQRLGRTHSRCIRQAKWHVENAEAGVPTYGGADEARRWRDLLAILGDPATNPHY